MAGHYSDLEAIERVVRRFADCTLPCNEWTHEAHLTVGLWHAREYPAAEALDRVRRGIRQYNVACGKVNSDTAGYHETITRFYMGLAGAYLGGVSKLADWLATTNTFIAEFGDRQLPLRWYSRDRLMSREARAAWVEPDLQTLQWPAYSRSKSEA